MITRVFKVALLIAIIAMTTSGGHSEEYAKALTAGRKACAVYKIGGPNGQGMCMFYCLFCANDGPPFGGLFQCGAVADGCTPGTTCLTNLGTGIHSDQAVHPLLEPGYTGGKKTAAEPFAPRTGVAQTVEEWVVKFNVNPMGTGGSTHDRWAKVVRVHVKSQVQGRVTIPEFVTVFGWEVADDAGVTFLDGEIIRRPGGMSKNRSRVAFDVAPGESLISEVIMSAP